MMFSFIVPCFNSEKYLRSCIKSLLDQKFNDFEIVVINDGSIDGTEKLLEEYKENPNIRIYHFDNKGLSYARRRGVSLSKGEYIIFVDSDDTVNSNLLSEVYKTVTKHKFPDTIRYQANLIGDKEKQDHQRYNFKNNLDVPVSGIDALRYWSTSGKKYALCWMYAFKKTIFSRISFDIELRNYADVALVPLLIAVSKTVVVIEYTGYNYMYNNPNSLANPTSIEKEWARALDFIRACDYAVENFARLKNVSYSDIEFFVKDYRRRLRDKYETLPEPLKGRFINEIAVLTQ